MTKLSTRDFLIGGAVFSAIGACLVRRRYGLLVFLLLIAGSLLLALFAFRVVAWLARKAGEYGAALGQGLREGAEEVGKDWKAAREARSAARRYFRGAEALYLLTDEVVDRGDGALFMRAKAVTDEQLRDGLLYTAWDPIKNPPVVSLMHDGREYVLEDSVCEIEGHGGSYLPLRLRKARQRRRRAGSAATADNPLSI